MRLPRQCTCTPQLYGEKQHSMGVHRRILHRRASMAGRQADLRTLIVELAPSVVWNHCMIHREQLASKELSVPIMNVLELVVTIVNYIKPHPLCASQYAKLCGQMGSQYDNMLFHTEAQWLSRGRVLERFFKLRNELLAFSRDVKKMIVSTICVTSQNCASLHM